MSNHDHLFVETPEPNLAAGMQYFNGSYTSYFNRRHRRCGHLFQRALVDERPTDPSVPQLGHLQQRPSIEAIVHVVAEHFGADPRRWAPGGRVDDASRAMAAYLARRRFGHPAGKVAGALGYRNACSVTRAVARIESGSDKLHRTATNLEKVLR